MKKQTLINLLPLLLIISWTAFCKITKLGELETCFGLAALTMCYIIAIIFACLSKKRKIYEQGLQVSSLNLYMCMKIAALAALYCSAWLFFFEMFSRSEEFLLPLISIICGVGLIVTFELIAGKIISGHSRGIFMLGCLISAAMLIIGSRSINELKWLFFAAYLFGQSLIFYSLGQMTPKLKNVLVLSEKSEQLFTLVDGRANLFAQAISCAVFTAVQAIAVHPNLDFTLHKLLNFGVCVLFVIGIIFAAAQPLDKYYEKKLDDFSIHGTPALKKQLLTMLGTTRKSLKYLFLRMLIRPFFPSKIIGAEHVDISSAPAIFVANHYEIYGPLVTIFRMPFRLRPWIIVQMLTPETVENQLRVGVNNVFKIFPTKMRKWILRLGSRLMISVLKELEPIPVYRGTTREVITTFKLTVEALEQGDNILIFPEKPPEGENYAQVGVDDFYSGFADIGAKFYKTAKKCVNFYPVYVDKKNKKIYIGEGIAYNPDLPRINSKKVISTYLNNSMRTLSENSDKNATNNKNADLLIIENQSENKNADMSINENQSENKNADLPIVENQSENKND